MQFTWDTVTFINLVLCIVIFTFGLISWRRTKNRLEILVGIAFGLFGLSHLSTLFGLVSTLGVWLIFIRTAAYLLVTYALFLAAYRPKSA